MTDLLHLYIGGEWVAPAGDARMPILNPATEAQIGTVAMGDARDVDRAVAAATAAFKTFAFTQREERLALLHQLRAATEARLEDLAQAMSAEMGAPITMAREAQADAAIGHLQGFIDAFDLLPDRETLPNGDVLLREPIGICGLITPWNWPINQIALKVISALATGCCCILKPSEHTPLSAAIYAEIIDAAGYPPGVFNLLFGDGMQVGSAMSRHPDIHMMSFTGSTRAGVAITKDAADTVKRVTLELGGKSPNLVFADADLETAVARAVHECMYNTGQSCNAPTRLLVERSCYEQVLGIAKATVKTLTIGDPSTEGDHLGPMFDQLQYDRVQALIAAGTKEGARVLAGGSGKPDGQATGWFIKPTIFADVSPDMTVYCEEIFGPVLVITPFDSEDEAIALANDSPYGLAAYLQTGDMTRAERVAARLRAGAVHINGGAYNYGSPFGGYKQSGNGREGGMWGQKWVESSLSLKNLDPSLLMWDMRRNLNPEPLPKQRTVVQFLYHDLPSTKRNWWLVIEPAGDVDLCWADPGFEVDLYISTPVHLWIPLRQAEALGRRIA